MNEINKPKDVTEVESRKFENCPLAKQLDNVAEKSTETNYDAPLAKEYKNNIEKDIENLSKEYLADLKRNSECPNTIPNEPFNSCDLKKRSPEETKALRQEFNRDKEKLISEWEKVNGREWPTYKNDVYNEYGELVRKAGWKYDAHHIQPLSIGGENESRNITPLRYEIHSDHKGIHEVGSPYDKLVKKLKEADSNE